MTKGSKTRGRILDIAEDAILYKGFAATSIEEIVAAAEITKGGFFYHFRDKNALAYALLQRYKATEDALFDGLFARARELADDPLQAFLIGVKLLAETLDDLPEGHPTCLVATYVYQDRLFDAEVRELNRNAMLGWRERFRAMLAEIAARYPPRDDVALDDLADKLSATVEGGIILSRALGEPHRLARQVLLYRSYVKLLFGPWPQ